MKFYELLLDGVEDLDLKIATKKAETDDSAGDTDFGQYVALLQKARKDRQEASQYHRQALEMQEYITHLVATGEGPLAENAPSSAAIEIFHQSQQALQQRAEEQARKNINNCK